MKKFRFGPVMTGLLLGGLVYAAVVLVGTLWAAILFSFAGSAIAAYLDWLFVNRKNP